MFYVPLKNSMDFKVMKIGLGVFLTYSEYVLKLFSSYESREVVR